MARPNSVRLSFSSCSLIQELSLYPPSRWQSLGLPPPVKSLSFLPFSVMHPKFGALFPSCNLSYESWLECCVPALVSTLVDDIATHFSTWSWYAGAYQGYCTSIFFLLEVYQNPKMPRADRIGVVLDHIYGPPSISTREKNRDVLRALARYLQRHLATCKMQPLQLPAESSAANSVMDSPLSFGMIDPSQRTNDWQAEMGYDQNYGQDVISSAVGDWWNYSAQYTIPEPPSSRETWAADFGMG